MSEAQPPGFLAAAGTGAAAAAAADDVAQEVGLAAQERRVRELPPVRINLAETLLCGPKIAQSGQGERTSTVLHFCGLSKIEDTNSYVLYVHSFSLFGSCRNP